MARQLCSILPLAVTSNQESDQSQGVDGGASFNEDHDHLIAFALALFLSPIALADIIGQPRVIDGDTIEVLA